MNTQNQPIPFPLDLPKDANDPAFANDSGRATPADQGVPPPGGGETRDPDSQDEGGTPPFAQPPFYANVHHGASPPDPQEDTPTPNEKTHRWTTTDPLTAPSEPNWPLFLDFGDNSAPETPPATRPSNKRQRTSSSPTIPKLGAPMGWTRSLSETNNGAGDRTGLAPHQLKAQGAAQDGTVVLRVPDTGNGEAPAAPRMQNAHLLGPGCSGTPMQAQNVRNAGDAHPPAYTPSAAPPNPQDPGRYEAPEAQYTTYAAQGTPSGRPEEQQGPPLTGRIPTAHPTPLSLHASAADLITAQARSGEQPWRGTPRLNMRDERGPPDAAPVHDGHLMGRPSPATTEQMYARPESLAHFEIGIQPPHDAHRARNRLEGGAEGRPMNDSMDVDAQPPHEVANRTLARPYAAGGGLLPAAPPSANQLHAAWATQTQISENANLTEARAVPPPMPSANSLGPPETRAQFLTRTGRLTVLPRPPQNWPTKFGSGTDDLLRALPPQMANQWRNLTEETHLILEIGDLPEDADEELLDGVGRRLMETLEIITEDTNIHLGRPPRRMGTNGESSAAFLAGNFSKTGLDRLKEETVWPTPLITIYVHRVFTGESPHLVTYGPFTTHAPKVIIDGVIGSILLSPARDVLAAALAHEQGGQQGEDCRKIAEDYIRSLTVKVHPVPMNEGPPCATAAVYSPQLTRDAGQWRPFRVQLANVLVTTIYDFRIPAQRNVRCTSCVAGDHFRPACPFAALPGWFGKLVPGNSKDDARAREAQQTLVNAQYNLAPMDPAAPNAHLYLLQAGQQGPMAAGSAPLPQPAAQYAPPPSYGQIYGAPTPAYGAPRTHYAPPPATGPANPPQTTPQQYQPPLVPHSQPARPYQPQYPQHQLPRQQTNAQAGPSNDRQADRGDDDDYYMPNNPQNRGGRGRASNAPRSRRAQRGQGQGGNFGR